MAIVATNLDGGRVQTVASQATASISPVANSLILVSVQNHVGSGTPNTPTVTGASMTWVAINTAGTGLHKTTIFRGLSSSPGSGALTIDFASQSQNAVLWSVDQFTNVDPGGANGANAVVQSATQTTTGSSTGITVTLGAFSNTNNATYGMVGTDQTPGISVGGSFSSLNHQTGSGGESSAEWAVSNQTSVNWTWGSASLTATAVAVEIKAINPQYISQYAIFL